MREAFANITNSLTSTVTDKAIDSVMALVATEMIGNHEVAIEDDIVQILSDKAMENALKAVIEE